MLKISITLGGVALAVMLNTGVAAQSEMATLSCTGPFARNATAADIVKFYGRENVRNTSVDAGEGMTERATVIYPTDPRRRIEVLWDDQKQLAKPRLVRISERRSQWRVTTGLGIGSTLKQAELSNNGPFVLTGFGWEYGGTVTSWGDGAIDAVDRKNGCLTHVRFTTTDASAPQDDGDYKSSDPRIQKAKPVVAVIGFTFPDDIATSKTSAPNIADSKPASATPPSIVGSDKNCLVKDAIYSPASNKQVVLRLRQQGKDGGAATVRGAIQVPGEADRPIETTAANGSAREWLSGDKFSAEITYPKETSGTLYISTSEAPTAVMLKNTPTFLRQIYGPRAPKVTGDRWELVGCGQTVTAAPVAISACITDRVTAPLRGILREHHFKHPNGTKLTAYHLVLPEARCFSTNGIATDGRAKTTLREVMLVQTKGQGIPLDRFLGKEVLVTGDIIEGETAWYSTRMAIDLVSISAVSQ